MFADQALDLCFHIVIERVIGGAHIGELVLPGRADPNGVRKSPTCTHHCINPEFANG